MQNKLPQKKKIIGELKFKPFCSGGKSSGLHRQSRWGKRKKTLRSKEASAACVSSPGDDRWDVSEFNVPMVEGMSRFHDLDLSGPLLHGICDLGFEYCTPIQAAILPSVLSGRDASGRAHTGTGKTAAFLITVINRIMKNPLRSKRKPGTSRILILAPTRELVLQISDEARQLSKYCGLKILSIFGGMNYLKQRKDLAAGSVDIIVATPGRLLDFKRNRDIILSKTEVLIIDEADRMLDMGFVPDVRKIINSTPAKDKRQTLLFSATLTRQITRLASQWTRNSLTIEIESAQIVVGTVEQIVYIVTAREKFALLFNIIDKQEIQQVLVFCNRRDEVTHLTEMLIRYGINCSQLSGDIPQEKRIKRLEQFKAGKIRVLVATDIVGRGIHVEGMEHVINFTLPHDPQDYVHRIGRTGRAGTTGTSVSFADEDDSFYIPAIEKFIDHKLSCVEPKQEWLTMPKPVLGRKKRGVRRRKRMLRDFQGEKLHRSRTKKDGLAV